MRDVYKLAAQKVVILLVDDDEDCRQLIRDAIRQGKLENEVFEVSSGEEALAFMRREGRFADAPRPGLVYLDIEMPGISGQEALKQIRADPRFSDVAIVMMTGVTDDAQKREAMSNGANSYTNKPTDAVSFIETVLQSTNYWVCIHQFPSIRAAAGAA